MQESIVVAAYELGAEVIEELNGELTYNAITYALKERHPAPGTGIPDIEDILSLSTSINQSKCGLYYKSTTTA